MRIAFISLMESQPWGGSEVLWKKTAETALEAGHSVEVSVVDWGKDHREKHASLTASGARIHFRNRFNPNLPVLRKLIRTLRRKWLGSKYNWAFLHNTRPDFVLINQGGCFDVIQHHLDLYKLLRERNIPYALLSHSHPQFAYLPEPVIREWGKQVFGQASLNYFISQTQRKVVEKALLCPLPNVRVTWNPLNIQEPQIMPWPETRTLRMAMVAGIVSGKGHDILLEVLDTEEWKERDWMLNVYGAGPGSAYVRELCTIHGLDDRVRFLGHVDDASDIWEKNHLLLCPSSGEGLPISIVEALACGRPVVSTDVGGIREILEEGSTGFLAEGAGTRSFGMALERAWTARAEWKKMGTAAHASILKHVDLKPAETLLRSIVRMHVAHE